MPRKKTYILIAATLLVSMPAVSYSFCLKNCRQEKSSSSFDSSSYGYSAPYQEENTSMGDVKNTVFGDMNVRVGHERIDIKTETDSNRNVIDASINSTIILGDMVK